MSSDLYSNKRKKRQKLRNNEYYDTQQLHDMLYENSKKGQKFTDLMQYITSEENIKLAYRNIKKNKGANTKGTDILTTEYIGSLNVETYVKDIQAKLQNYHPKSVRRVMIPKPNGKLRPLGIPCIEDRLIQQCIKQVIEPICEAKFHRHSYGFRPNRSAKHAIARFNSLVHRAQTHYVVDIDIKGFFDNVDHSKLMKQLWTLGIRDKNLLCILKKILTSEIQGEGVPNKGTPQGGIISPLLSNIVLNELDWWVSDQWETFETRTKYSVEYSRYPVLKKSNMKEMFLVRYADDFKILCRDSKTAFKIFNAVKKWLKTRLGLEISPEKSKVTNLRKNHTEFLGIKLMMKPKKGRYVCNSHVTDSRKKNIMVNIRNQIKRIQHDKHQHSVRRLNAMIMGMHNYYNMASHVVKDFNRIDFLILQTLKKRLKPSNKGGHSKTYIKNYGKYTGRKVMKVCGIDIFPLYGCTNKPPRGFNQKMCSYTVEGRQLIHDAFNPVNSLVIYLLKTAVGQSVEYNDNRISLLVAQKGCCGVTKQTLKEDTMHCHHKRRKADGGTDEYKNLVWLHKDIHILVHATVEETINQYRDKLKLTVAELKKVNSFRKLAGNFEI